MVIILYDTYILQINDRVILRIIQKHSVRQGRY